MLNKTRVKVDLMGFTIKKRELIKKMLYKNNNMNLKGDNYHVV